MRIHFVGIGGKGVSQVAKFFSYLVLGSKDATRVVLSGSDIKEVEKKFPVNILINIPQSADVIDREIAFAIVSPVVLKFNNPEISALRNLNIPVIEFFDLMEYLQIRYLEEGNAQEFIKAKPNIFEALDNFFAKHFTKKQIIKTVEQSKLLPFYFYDFSGFKMLALTGTDGKTTTSSMLFHLAKKLGKKVAVITTVGAYIWNGESQEEFTTGLHQTTPGADVLLDFFETFRKNKIEVVILEVTSHALAQHRIAGMKFDVVGYTNITQEHLNFHKTKTEYIKAKSLLFRKHLKRGGTLVANTDDFGTRKMLRSYGRDLGNISAHVIFYGAKKRCMDKLEKSLKVESLERILISHIKDSGSILKFYLQTSKNKKKVELPVFGSYNAYNLTLAFSMGCLGAKLGCDMSLLSNIFVDYKLPVGRMKVMKNNPLVIVDFAHTPNGLLQMLKTLRNVADKRKGQLFVAFGTAGERDKGKRFKMGKIADKWADVIFLTAEDPRRESLYDINLEIIRGILAGESLEVKKLELVKKLNRENLKNKGKVVLKTADGKPLKIGYKKLSEFKDAYVFDVNGKMVYDFFEEKIASRYNAIYKAILLAKPEDVVVITGKAHEQSLAFGLTEYEWNDIEAVEEILNDIDV